MKLSRVLAHRTHLRGSAALPSALVCLAIGACGGPQAQDPAMPSTGEEAAEGASEGGEEGSPLGAQGDPAASAGEEPSPPSEEEKLNLPPVAEPVPADSGRFQLATIDVKTIMDSNLKRLHMRCWDPAKRKLPKGPNKVRVATELEVNPDGTVKIAKVVGGKEYAGLAACVEKEMREWRFPKTKSTSNPMFPIVFEKTEEMVMEDKS